VKRRGRTTNASTRAAQQRRNQVVLSEPYVAIVGAESAAPNCTLDIDSTHRSAAPAAALAGFTGVGAEFSAGLMVVSCIVASLSLCGFVGRYLIGAGGIKIS
jgi:hypothetical protein